jgi:hypothetical protein
VVKGSQPHVEEGISAPWPWDHAFDLCNACHEELMKFLREGEDFDEGL